jgi:7-cyano-7-deazaguanine synthase
MAAENIILKKAVVLFSGGLDSTTTLAIAGFMGFELYALTIDYGQRHIYELQSAMKISSILSVKSQKIVKIDLRTIGGSALTDDKFLVPSAKNQNPEKHNIPVTYVPARNTIFLSIALAYAEVIDSYDIFIGVNALDYSGYPDCRQEFIAAFEKLTGLATKKGVEEKRNFRIHAPLINMTKAEIIKKGIELDIDLSLTHSCYNPDPSGYACGICDSCILRKKGFIEAGISDPTKYVTI